MIRSVVAVLLLASIIFVAAAFLHRSSNSAPEDSQVPVGTAGPVLVELFTSEGCSSCPPADKLLGELDQKATFDGVPVIALGEHVDYWDGQGWKDRFSSAAYTERQKKFGDRLGIDSVYTPQMVVDGRIEFVGNDEGALKQALTKAANTAKPVTIDLAWDGAKESLKISANDAGKHRAQVLLAITESGLTTSVERGENSGRVLQHAAVVRRLIRVGSLSDSKFTSIAPVSADASWKRGNLKAIVFVQDEASDTILGAQAIAFPKL